MGEILQTSPAANPFGFLFDSLLASGTTNLMWKEDGLGRSVEMRRAFSAIFGRFFARAYLECYHNFTWFGPISGDPTYFSKRFRVTRTNGSKAYLPDWLCAGKDGVAIGEAKGSHSSAKIKTGSHPDPIKTAINQINGVAVQKFDSFSQKWVDRSVKGWAVMSRWGVENPIRDAYQYVLDPVTPGTPICQLKSPTSPRKLLGLT